MAPRGPKKLTGSKSDFSVPKFLTAFSCSAQDHKELSKKVHDYLKQHACDTAETIQYVANEITAKFGTIESMEKEELDRWARSILRVEVKKTKRDSVSNFLDAFGIKKKEYKMFAEEVQAHLNKGVEDSSVNFLFVVSKMRKMFEKAASMQDVELERWANSILKNEVKKYNGRKEKEKEREEKQCEKQCESQQENEVRKVTIPSLLNCQDRDFT